MYTVYCNTLIISICPHLQQYKESDLIQPLQWPLNTTYPLMFNQYIYFFASKENRNTFQLNPLRYLRQPGPTPSLPVKIAIIGPPKSGKTTGKTFSQMHISHLFDICLHLFAFTSLVAQMLAQKYGLVRLSIGGVVRMVLNTREHTDLAVQMKKHLSQGLVVPDEMAIQCLEVALMSLTCSTQG